MDTPDPSTYGQPPGHSDVELRLPADSAFVSVLRTAASGLAARLDFTIDDIEDLRMAVSEACSLVLPSADPGSDLVAEFFLGQGSITAAVSVPTSGETPDPSSTDPDSWAWQVLTALTTDVAASSDDGRFTVTMTVHSVLDV